MKSTFALLVLGFTLQVTATLKLNDLDGLTGKKWAGALTYLDYGTGKPVVIPTELTVADAGKGPGVYTWATVYPKEPSHNGKDEVIISKDGKIFDGETVIARTIQPDGLLKFTTQKDGMDDNKKAQFRITYTLGKTTFTRKKEVCFAGETKWFTRNELSLTTDK